VGLPTPRRVGAYARGSSGGGRLILSECCYLPEHPGAVRPLLHAFWTLAARAGCAQVEAVLPEDHPAVAFCAEQPLWSAAERSPLLFRLVDLTRLLGRIEPLLTQRLLRIVLPREPLFLDLVVGEHTARLAVTPDGVRVMAPGDPSPGPHPTAHEVRLEPEEFFLLLFGQASSSELSGAVGAVAAPARAVLTALFPRGAPIYWRPDIV
jgi:hypothetical protein